VAISAEASVIFMQGLPRLRLAMTDGMPKIGTDSYHPCLSYYNPFVNCHSDSFVNVILKEPFAPVILRREATKDLAQDKLRDLRISTQDKLSEESRTYN
jgi:hypothetical protein